MVRLKIFLIRAIPSFITFALFLAGLMPYVSSLIGSVFPVLSLLPVYFWGLLYSRQMPYWVVFVLGVLMDTASGTLMGLSSLLNIAFLALVHAQARLVPKEGFIITWGVFAGLLVVYTGLRWISYSLLSGVSMPMIPCLLQWLLTVSVYPFFHKIFEQLEHWMEERQWRLLHSR